MRLIKIKCSVFWANMGGTSLTFFSGGHERGRDGDLEDGTGGDVELLDGHDGLVEVVVHRDLEALARHQVERVVERLRVQEHTQPVRLANLNHTCSTLNREHNCFTKTR